MYSVQRKTLQRYNFCCILSYYFLEKLLDVVDFRYVYLFLDRQSITKRT